MRASFLLLLFAAAGPLRAEIRETASLAEALRGVSTETLVVLDTDNTILKPRQMLGGEAWTRYYVQKETRAGMERGRTRAEAEALAFAEAYGIWVRVHRPGGAQPVEPSTPALIRAAQDRGVRLMVLSAAASDFMAGRRRELLSIGVDMSRTAPFHGRLKLAPGVDYENGLLLTTFQDKGRALAAFFEKKRWRPARIVFVDDSRPLDESVERAMARIGVKTVCHRYGAADETYRAFEPAVADLQLKAFLSRGELLSDDRAREILKGGARPSAEIAKP